MSFKKIIPLYLRELYQKIAWFSRNFSNINKFAVLRSNHYHGLITYDTDGLTTSNNCDFISEAAFSKAYASAAATNPWEGFTLHWRVYIVCWFANSVKHLEGDFVECGVNTGAYARAVIDYISFEQLNKTFYLFDTFSGLVPNQITEKEKESGIEKYLGNYHDVYEDVKRTFSGFPVVIVRGMIPETLAQCKSEKICYLSIDMNVVEPEIAAAHYFWDKIVRGGVVLLDDYGFPQHINQKRAFDQFAKDKGVEILCLPTGQGVIFKK